MPRLVLLAAAIGLLPLAVMAQQSGLPTDETQAKDTFEISAGVRASDNIAREPIAASGATGTLGILLEVNHPTGTLKYASNADLDYLHYFSQSFRDEVLGEFAGTASYALIPHGLVWVSDENFGQVTTDYFLAPGPQNRQYLNEFSTGPDFRMRLANTLALRLSGRYGRDDYQISPYSNSRVSGEAAIERRPSEATLLSLGASHEHVDYQRAVAQPGNFSLDHYFGGYTIAMPRTSINMQGGYSASSGGLAYLHGPTGYLTLDRQVTASSHVFLDFRRTLNTVSQGSRASDFLPGVIGVARAEILTGSLYFLEMGGIGYRWQRPRTAVNLSAVLFKETDHLDLRPDRKAQSLAARLAHRLTPLADVGLYARWSHDKAQGPQLLLPPPIGLGLTTDQFAATDTAFGVSYRQRFSRYFAASVDLNHLQRTADIGRYRENAIWVRLAYAPLPAHVEPN